MGFPSRRRTNPPMPAVNLLPLMDVLMSILAFFILISMTLTRQQLTMEVQLPGVSTGTTVQNAPDPFIVVLNAQGQLFFNSQGVTQGQLEREIEAYLNQNPEGTVMLNADRQLTYDRVLQLLGQMRAVGGDRVSLAITPE